MSQALTHEGRVLVPQCRVARGFFERFWGLMGRRAVAPEEGLLFPKCNSVHTFFMRVAIDVIFLSREGEVVAMAVNVRPWRLLLPRKRARHVLELAANRSVELGLRTGMRLETQGVFG